MNRNLQISYEDYETCVIAQVTRLAEGEGIADAGPWAQRVVLASEPIVRESYDNGVSVDALAQAML